MIPWKTASDSVNSCVEVAWTRSARCSHTDCLEAVRTTGDHGRVLVRDSKEAPDYHVQQWTPREWAELLRAARIDAEHPAVKKLDGSVLLWSGPGQPVHRYTQVEWDAFTRGALKGMFEYESLPDVGEWIEPSSCKCDKLSGPAEASPGGGPAAGRVVEPAGIGLDQAATGADVTVPDTAPVAALRPLADAATGTSTSYPDKAASADGSGLRPGPATGAGEVGATSSRPAPVAAEPIPRMVPTTCGRCYPGARCVCRDNDSSLDDEIDTIVWKRDQTLGEPQGPSRGAARRAGQGPVLADRSGVEAAGTGALPPALVPAADAGGCDCHYCVSDQEHDPDGVIL